MADKVQNPTNLDVTIKNTQIHDLFVRRQFKECLNLIEIVKKEHSGTAEYAMYVQALIKRQTGNVKEALDLFQKGEIIFLSLNFFY
jgi:Bardet-Biedl syndrome 4 protein